MIPSRAKRAQCNMSEIPAYVLLRVGDSIVGTGKYFTGFTSSSKELSRTLHGSPLRDFAIRNQDLVAIYSIQIFSEFRDTPYPYCFGGPEDPPRHLGDLNQQGGYFKSLIAWDNRDLVPSETGCDLKDSPSFVSATSFFAVSRRFQKEGSGHSLPRTRFSRLNKNASGHSFPTSIPQSTTQFDVESVSCLEEVGNPSNGLEGESRTLNAPRNLISTTGSSEHSSLSDEEEHTKTATFVGMDGSENDSSSDNEDESSDSSVDPASCSNVMPFPNKRAYVYRKRKKAIPEGPRELRKRRKVFSQRMDNPFLINGLRCCKSKRCYENIDPIYAFKRYNEVMALNREDFKSFLISIYDAQDHSFKMLGKTVCARYLQKGFGFSNDLQCSVKNTPRARAGPTSLALPRDVRRTTKKDSIINFLRNYADDCGDMMPNAFFTNLPDAGRLNVYKKFAEDFRKHRPSESAPTRSFFYAIWRSHCTEIRTRRNHGFARCETCVLLKAEISQNQNRASVVRQATASLRQHLNLVMEERKMYQNRAERAIRYPKKYTSIVIDGADQKGYGLPHFLDSSKADRGHKFKVKCVDCLEHRSSKKLWIYAMTEEFQTGANHIIEVIHRVLMSRKAENGKLTEVLYVQVDNCSRENKNRYTLGFFELLVALGVFLEVEASFLPVGHTHTDIDQSFSVVSRLLDRSDAATMEELLSAIDSCYLGKASALRLEKVANISGLCEETKCVVNARSLGGFMNFRYFRFTRATGNMPDGGAFKTQCHVKVQFRDDWQPISLSSTREFLKHVPDLRQTPPTETFPPENVTEINKCLESLHAHGGKLARRVLPELEALREVVYTKREDPLHWDLEQSVEFNGDFASDGHEDGLESDEASSDEENMPEYEPESFVAVKPPQGTTSKFWIAMILKVVDRSSSNRPRWLEIMWYSQKRVSREGRDEFSSKYVPSQVYDSRRKRHVPYKEQIEVETILLHFQSLNTQGHLLMNTRTALRQVLGLN